MEGYSLRKCQNIKSRRYRSAPCSSAATHGDFCSRHYKNPIRFESQKPSVSLNRILTRSEHQAVLQIQRFWKKWAARQRYSRQGPASNDRTLSQNSTEVYTLESLETIPLVFFFSFADCNRSIWSFDIRSLSHLLKEGSEPQNPYTRQILSPSIIEKVHSRLVWLRKRKYPTLHETGENLTPEQIWNQKVLDVFFKMDALGYRASCRWFDDMVKEEHALFYSKLYRLWTYQLGLTPQEKEDILPGCTKIFKQTPERAVTANHDLKWWRRTNLNMILEFISRGTSKSQQGLGALYVIMGIVQVIPEAAEAYPWIVESLR